MKGTIISPNGEFYTTKDLDAFIQDITKEVSLKDLIESQEFSLQVKDSLEQLVQDGELEKGGNGTEEDQFFEGVRKTVKVLKKKLKAQSVVDEKKESP
jgi:hypothetical protein